MCKLGLYHKQGNYLVNTVIEINLHLDNLQQTCKWVSILNTVKEVLL